MTGFKAFKQLTENLEEIKCCCDNWVSQSGAKKLTIRLEDIQLL